MPVSCTTTALTGQEGSIFFKPAGTSFCLLDFTDFPATSPDIFVPNNADYRIGDPVVFTEEGTANLDSALTPGTTYYVIAQALGAIAVSATPGGAGILMNGDGGTGAADTPGSANHISIALADHFVICDVKEYSAEITREELDTTTLPCGPAGFSKWAPFRKTQPGYATGTGTMSVQFTADQASVANRLRSNALLKNQEGASVKLYTNTVSDGVGGVDDGESLYIESDITITSFDVTVNLDDATVGELAFNLIRPRQIFGTVIS